MPLTPGCPTGGSTLPDPLGSSGLLGPDGNSGIAPQFSQGAGSWKSLRLAGRSTNKPSGGEAGAGRVEWAEIPLACHMGSTLTSPLS